MRIDALKLRLAKKLFVGVIFVALLFVVSECHAQRHRGLFRRGARVQNEAQLQHPTSQSGIVDGESTNFHRAQNSGWQQQRRLNFYPAAPRFYDSQTARYLERYPKYYGGFHASHFNNVGVPSGDIGFRGNGIYWTPW